MSYKVLKDVKTGGHTEEGGKLHHLYEKNARPLIESKRKRIIALAVVLGLLGLSLLLIP